MKHTLPLVLSLLCLAAPAGVAARTWNDASGRRQMDADLVDFRDGQVSLRRIDGQTVTLPIEEFSEPDRQYVREEAARRRAAQPTEVSGRPAAVLYGTPRRLATLANRRIDESSGLACSRRTDGVFWTHNASGDAARLYAFDAQGKDLGTFALKDVVAFDFEDMASFVLDGQPRLLVGDIGNNGLAGTVQVLLLVEEPPLGAAGPLPVLQTILFRYADARRDCEALAVDPTTRTILLVTKQRDAECFVYALPWPENDPKKVFVARRIATLRIPTVTAMDVSPDGRRAVILTYGDGYETTRRDGEDWAAAFARPPARIAMPQRVQGESICYGPDGKTLLLTSEKTPTPLWEVPPRQAGAEPARHVN